MVDAKVAFGASWEKAVKGSQSDILDVMKKAYTQLFADIVYTTPVDTGRLRGNWTVSFDSQLFGETGKLDRSGYGTISDAKSEIQNMELDSKIFFNNNAPYAYEIEYGRSTKKAPYGMVRINVARFSDIVDSFIKRSK